MLRDILRDRRRRSLKAVVLAALTSGMTSALMTGCGESTGSSTASSTNLKVAMPTPPPLSFRATSLVDRDGLEAMLGKPNVRVLDTRPLDEYLMAHIPGAIRVDPEVWTKQGHVPNGLTDSAFWSEAFSALGIREEMKVVVYGGNSPTNAGRVWWHLRYAGVQHAMLLDGGWPLWKTGGKPTQKGNQVVDPTDFHPVFQSAMLAEFQEILNAVQNDEKSLAIVDSRSLREFDGIDIRGARGGHIPGAIHLEWKELLDVNGQFKSDEEIQKLFEERGVRAGQTVAAHCQSGGRSSLEVFGLMLAGYANAKNYYGSWVEWSASENAPVE